MATIKELEKYLHYEFSTGTTTGNDYKQFQTKYINYLKNICTKNNWKILNINRSHYIFSLFISDGITFVFFSIPDARYDKNEWYDNILIRKAKNEYDYSGGHNQRVTLPDIETRLKRIFNGERND